eukprot:1869466-Amphidinium_carterae.1
MFYQQLGIQEHGAHMASEGACVKFGHARSWDLLDLISKNDLLVYRSSRLRASSLELHRSPTLEELVLSHVIRASTRSSLV